MSERRHIFYNVVKDENSLTELLRNFLEVPLFRQLFCRDILKLEAEQFPTADEITTQRRLGDHGQPDIYIGTKEADIFIEVKVNNVGLTAAQPARYLDYLLQSEKKHKQLFFLLPNGYWHKPEIERREKEFYHAYPGQSSLVSILPWNDVIHLIDQYDLHRVSPLFADFRALLKSWFEPPVVILNAHLIHRMFQTDIPALIIKLYATIDVLSGTLGSKGYQITKKKNENEYGLYLYTREGTPLVYVGVWYGFWQQTGSPFCLAVAAHEHGADTVDRFKQYCRETHRGEPLHLAGWEGTGIPESRFRAASGTDAAELTKVVEAELTALIKYLSPGSST